MAGRTKREKRQNPEFWDPQVKPKKPSKKTAAKKRSSKKKKRSPRRNLLD